MKIVILDGISVNPGDLSWAGFEALGELDYYDRTPPELLAERLVGAEIVLVNKTHLTAEAIAAAKDLKYIGVFATGYNVVDVEAAKERGIPVCNIPTYSTQAVAQFVFALLLEITQRVGAHSEAVHDGEWTRQVDFCFWDYPLMELEGKTMGLIGFGNIAKATARLAKAFGMEVIAWNHRPKDGEGLAEMVSLEELYRRADVISLHVPLFADTQGMINRESIAKMKDGVILINTARGGLVNERDLTDALNSGKVYAAGVDVVSQEPMRPDNSLLEAKNCYITPHIAWAGKETRIRLIDLAVENLKAFLEGRPINVVNQS